MIKMAKLYTTPLKIQISVADNAAGLSVTFRLKLWTFFKMKLFG